MYIEVAVSSRPVVSRDNVAPVPVVDAESILNRAEASRRPLPHNPATAAPHLVRSESEQVQAEARLCELSLGSGALATALQF